MIESVKSVFVSDCARGWCCWCYFAGSWWRSSSTTLLCHWLMDLSSASHWSTKEMLFSFCCCCVLLCTWSTRNYFKRNVFVLTFLLLSTCKPFACGCCGSRWQNSRIQSLSISWYLQAVVDIAFVFVLLQRWHSRANTYEIVLTDFFEKKGYIKI